MNPLYSSLLSAFVSAVVSYLITKAGQRFSHDYALQRSRDERIFSALLDLELECYKVLALCNAFLGQPEHDLVKQNEIIAAITLLSGRFARYPLAQLGVESSVRVSLRQATSGDAFDKSYFRSKNQDALARVHLAVERIIAASWDAYSRYKP